MSCDILMVELRRNSHIRSRGAPPLVAALCTSASDLAQQLDHRVARRLFVDAELRQFALGRGVAESLHLQHQRGDLRRRARAGASPAPRLLDVTQAAFRPRLAHRLVLERELAQAAAEQAVVAVVIENGIDERLRRRALRQQSADHALFLVLPGAIDGKEDRGLVAEPAIKSLWREAGTPRDLVAVGTVEAVLIELA